MPSVKTGRQSSVWGLGFWGLGFGGLGVWGFGVLWFWVQRVKRLRASSLGCWHRMAVSIEGRGPNVGSQYTVTLARQGIRQTGSRIFGKPSEMFLAVRPAHDMYKDMGRNCFRPRKSVEQPFPCCQPCCNLPQTLNPQSFCKPKTKPSSKPVASSTKNLRLLYNLYLDLLSTHT